MPQILYINFDAVAKGDPTAQWIGYPQFEGVKSNITHTQAFIHICIGSFLFSLINGELIEDEEYQISNYMLFILVLGISMLYSVVYKILGLLVFWILTIIHTRKPMGKLVFYVLVCNHFWMGPYYFFKYMVSTIAYYYVYGKLNEHDPIWYNFLDNNNPLNRLCAPILAFLGMAIVFMPWFSQMRFSVNADTQREEMDSLITDKE